MFGKIKGIFKAEGIVMTMIPILICDLLIPLIAYILCIKYLETDRDLLAGNIYFLIQMLTPIISTIWIYGMLTMYIDEKGNEIFYILKRNRLWDTLIIFLMYGFINLIPYFGYVKIDSSFKFCYIHMLIVYFLLAALAYMCSYLFKEVALAIIPNLCYCFGSVLFDFGKFDKLSFYEPNIINWNVITEKYIFYIIIAICFFVIGFILNKKYTDYN